MDVGHPPPRPPRSRDRVALVLQGGGALGAYQAGVYQAMHEAGLEPDWLTGVSIGGINAALIAGNAPDRRLAALRAFWDTVTARPVSFWNPDGDLARKARNAVSSGLTALLGQPGFFTPNVPNPWLSLRGASTATAFYDSTPLRQTLLELVDFRRLNQGDIRYACGAVNVTTGNFAYFDTTETTIGPEHVMASAALPPALPMVRIGTDYFWDGGLVSNTPLQYLLDTIGSVNTLVFQVDLFGARGALPRDMFDVLGRQKDIQYSSRTRLVTDYYRLLRRKNATLARLLGRLPDAELTDEERHLKEALTQLPSVTILQMIYQQTAYEGQAKDYEFSAESMRDHWDAGLRDTRATLRRTDWLSMPPPTDGIAVHDIHAPAD